ncbi:hypothetical protein IRJ41_020754, partial [Triplophysa rosa]
LQRLILVLLYPSTEDHRKVNLAQPNRSYRSSIDVTQLTVQTCWNCSIHPQQGRQDSHPHRTIPLQTNPVSVTIQHNYASAPRPNSVSTSRSLILKERRS